MAIGRANAAYHLCMACLYVLIISSRHCTSTDTLSKDSPISVTQTLVSSNQVYELGFFILGNSTNRYLGIWFKNNDAMKIMWVANRENPLSVSDNRSSLTIGNDGNLRILDGAQNTVWSTNVRGPFNETVAQLTDMGDFCINDTASGSILWESFDYPGNSLLPGMKLGTKGNTQGKHLLSSWKSEDDPTPGDFVVGLSAEQPPQVFVWRNSKPTWRGGPWDGGKFIGIPEQGVGYSELVSLMPGNSQEGAYLIVNLRNLSIVPMLYLQPDGVFMTKYWAYDSNMWDSDWEVPANPCDVYGVCGAFAICTNTKNPICDCLRGFVPQSNDQWSKGNWTSGCVRRSELLCEKNETSLASGKAKPDKFWVLRGIKLPDHYQYFPYMDTDECRKRCLDNCACKAYANVQGINCLVWTEELMDIEQFSYGGENLFLRLSYADSGRKTKIDNFNSEEELVSRDTLQEDVLRHESCELPIFEFKQIIGATDHFSHRNKLGEGGFGEVYKGMLDDGQQIAVKRLRLSGNSGQGIEEFKNEIMLISKLQHRNLVKLLGCCIEGEERLLIYEYMTNKSLDTFLFDPKKRQQLDWATRFNIIQGIGRGLVYLHRDSCLRIIHRDLKCSNILLDEKMNPKISDFGLARCFQITQEQANTCRIIGTYGYMSPEYAMHGVMSEKSDVFSYGVMLLEIMSGKRNTVVIHDEQIFPLAHAWKSWKEGRGIEVMDQELGRSSCVSKGLRCIHVALLCVQDLPTDRPTMTEAVSMLCSENELPEPKEPLFTLQRLSSGHEFINMCSINGVTTSMTEGR
ncbi:putative protein kinase RLK-Pelle-DLSV family [Helianthus annuus]|uniref:Receptor-like serine/threonine-protein kinase n=1 Tax=Helianthus annuus TaxID=4232 RepID=A0A251ULD7_HELAN|nr:putative protein kinase RLK-Pelle-DLSV family [Helianthus annuus]KAJ0568888.1 putative protein kinase RLK-Pelle-DLSV family [Helianthus annuus]KAJ0583171.1 putative protein kinase RLK-Pelle-DLSV family [Helianthus annuus]